MGSRMRRSGIRNSAGAAITAEEVRRWVGRMLVAGVCLCCYSYLNTRSFDIRGWGCCIMVAETMFFSFVLRLDS